MPDNTRPIRSPMRHMADCRAASTLEMDTRSSAEVRKAETFRRTTGCTGVPGHRMMVLVKINVLVVFLQLKPRVGQQPGISTMLIRQTDLGLGITEVRIYAILNTDRDSRG
jgi:hypothetical protein